MKRTALYLRASSRDQIQHGFSIPDQLTRLRSEALVASERVVAEFVDQARSGTSALKRADYQNLLAAARRHEFDRVRFESVDRGHRNDLDRRQFEAEMTALGIDVIYSGEPEKQAPQFRKLQRGIKGVLAEWESDETSQRTYKRHRYRAQQGKWRGGHPPYGTKPDGKGWLESDGEAYPYLIWILERRAESQGHHVIAKMLNAGIDVGDGLIVPPTPSLLAYRRKPYLERQDPETGDVIHLPRPLPSANWKKKTIEHICRQAVDGAYAGILNWGHRHNRFLEDMDGNVKLPVSVDTGRPLVPLDLLEQVRVVELTSTDSPQRMSTFNLFLLSLRCGFCGQAMHGYTSTKTKPSGLSYKYRKYRCAGRANKPGACSMPILSAEALEQVVINAVFLDAAQRDGERLQDETNAAIERQRLVLLEALALLEAQLPALARQREEALIAVIDQALPAALKKAIIERAERLVIEYQENEAQQLQIRAALDSLTAKARSVLAVLTDPNLDPSRWREPAVFAAFRRALTLLVKKAVVSQGSTRFTFFVELSVTTDPIAEPQNGSVVNLGNSRARGSRTHRRGSSPRPLVLKTRTATGPHPLSCRILLARRICVNDTQQRANHAVRPHVYIRCQQAIIRF
jgi:DNA invertase Pin-like site-specific DNA recombinase